MRNPKHVEPSVESEHEDGTTSSKTGQSTAPRKSNTPGSMGSSMNSRYDFRSVCLDGYNQATEDYKSIVGGPSIPSGGASGSGGVPGLLVIDCTFHPKVKAWTEVDNDNELEFKLHFRDKTGDAASRPSRLELDMVKGKIGESRSQAIIGTDQDCPEIVSFRDYDGWMKSIDSGPSGELSGYVLVGSKSDLVKRRFEASGFRLGEWPRDEDGRRVYTQPLGP